MTYQLDFADNPRSAAEYHFLPGQFNMVYFPGIGEVAISISSDPTAVGCSCTRSGSAGNVTRALGRKQVGADSRPQGPVRFDLAAWQLQGPGHRHRLRRRRAGPAPAGDLRHLSAPSRITAASSCSTGPVRPGDLLFAREYDAWRKPTSRVEVTVDIGDARLAGKHRRGALALLPPPPQAPRAPTC